MIQPDYIPKIIHFCWFGGNEKPEIVQKCIASWRKFLPDYEIKEWNESNTQMIQHPYFKSALKNGKWAFAADYARFYLLKEYGGIYLDSDEEVFSDFDNFLKFDFFLGFERYGGCVSPMAGVVGAKPNNKDIVKFLAMYDEVNFMQEKSCFDMTPITVRLKSYFIQNYNLPADCSGMSAFTFGENSVIFPANYFCEYSGIETIAMHHYSFSWEEDVLQVRYRIFCDPVSDTHNFSIYIIPKKEMPKNCNEKLLFKCAFFGYIVLLVREPIITK